eukprot:gb/GFBE01025442.1/.p1 GENE.gb/GFBE01025442.1/~~gb/GFBE01025442.1/.p1  ORF type:complete len:299 (+),score=47.67 gb/GFBE01025442.1/:1-897(+)
MAGLVFSASFRNWLLFLAHLAVLQGDRSVLPFTNLQVSSAMTVTVTTDPSRSQPSVTIIADDRALGWTVETVVLPLTFGNTLYLGMDNRAKRQGFRWRDGDGRATIVVPQPLTSISVAGGAKVHADFVTGDLAASSWASIVVGNVEALSSNRSRVVRAETGGNVSVEGGALGRTLIQASGESTWVNLTAASLRSAEIEAEQKAHVLVNVTETCAVMCDSGAKIQIMGGANVTERSVDHCGGIVFLPVTEIESPESSDNDTELTETTTAATATTAEHTDARTTAEAFQASAVDSRIVFP